MKGFITTKKGLILKESLERLIVVGLVVLVVVGVVGYLLTGMHYCFDVLVEWKVSKIVSKT